MAAAPACSYSLVNGYIGKVGSDEASRRRSLLTSQMKDSPAFPKFFKREAFSVCRQGPRLHDSRGTCCLSVTRPFTTAAVRSSNIIGQSLYLVADGTFFQGCRRLTSVDEAGGELTPS